MLPGKLGPAGGLPGGPSFGAAAPLALETPLLEVIFPPAPTPAQRGYHRYVGTVKGRPVLVELHAELAYPTAPYFSCEGTCYYLGAGQPQALVMETMWEPTQPLELLVDEAHWCLRQPRGPTLSGACISSSGQPLGRLYCIKFTQ